MPEVVDKDNDFSKVERERDDFMTVMTFLLLIGYVPKYGILRITVCDSVYQFTVIVGYSDSGFASKSFPLFELFTSSAFSIEAEVLQCLIEV